MMGLAGRIGRLEIALGTDAEPRRIIVYYGDGYAESWIERGSGWEGRDLAFHVRTPAEGTDDDSRRPAPDVAVARAIAPQPHCGPDPMEYLTPEMRREIRPTDTVVCFEVLAVDGRNPHLQAHLPPWRRRPSRLDPECRHYEIEAEPGHWVRYSIR